MRNTYAHRALAVVDTASGDYISETEFYANLGPAPALPTILAALPCSIRTLYLTGPAPTRQESVALWFADPALAGWRCDFADLSSDLPMVTLTHTACPAGKEHKLDIRRAAAWFGEGDYAPNAAMSALLRLEGAVMAEWDTGAKLLGTPGATGRDLWARTTREEYAPIDEGLQRLIRATSGQGRIQILTPAWRETIPALYGYDGRWMYAALCRELPVGPGRLEKGPFGDIDPYARARYHIVGHVPDTWAHVGLVGVRDRDTDGWCYPATPGAPLDCWIDGAELQLCQLYSWHHWFRVTERISFAAGHPLDRWIKKMVSLRARYQLQPDTVGRLCAAAVRNMVLHTIGQFHRGQDAYPVVIYPDQLAAYNGRDFVQAPELLPDGTLIAKVQKPLSAANAFFQHPEWSAAIYGRARARLLLTRSKDGPPQGMLQIARDELLACYTDAIYTAQEQPWTDSGNNGQFRQKIALAGPLPAPHTHRAMQQLAARARREMAVV